MRYTWAWVFLTLLYLAARYQNTPGVLTSEGIELNDTDPYYRLHRIEAMVSGSLAYPLHDPDLSFPNGFDVPWPTGLDLVLAIPLKILGVKSEKAIETFCALAIPILSLPTLWLFGWLTYVIAGPLAALAAGFLISLSPAASYASDVGRLDHHFLETMLTTAALAALILRRERPDKRAPWIYLGLILTLGPLFWPQAWVLSLFIALSFLLDTDPVPREVSPSFFLGCALASLIPLFFSDRFSSGAISIFGLSWWPPLLYSGISLFFSLFSICSHGKPRFRQVHVWSAACAIGIATFLFFKNGRGFLVSPANDALSALAPSGNLLAHTSESIPTALIPIWRWPDMGLIPLFLVWVWFMFQAFRKERWWMIGYFLGPMILCIAEARFAALSMPVLLLGSVLLLQDFSQKLVVDARQQMQLFSILAIALAIPSLPKASIKHEGNQHPLFKSVRDVAHFIQDRNESRKIPKSKSAIAAHWDFGHWLLHYAHVPVVAHPFQSESTLDILRLFTSEEANALDRFVTKYPVRYLLVEGPTMRLRNWVELSGKDPSTYINFEKDGPGGPDFHEVKPRFYQLLTSRFYIQGGVDPGGTYPENWRLIYLSPFEFYGKRGAPSLKLYERVPGVTIRTHLKRNDVLLTAKIQTSDNSFTFLRPSKRVSPEVVEWTIPYAKTNEGGVSFDGTAHLEIPSGQHFTIRHLFADSEVSGGKTIDIPPPRF